MLVFPAIDLLGGKAVRLSQGRRETATIYSHHPWELAKSFAAAGAPRLHVVDLDAAFTGGATHNREVIHRLAAAAGAAGVDLEIGGGVRTLDDCRAMFNLGAKYAVLGTAAVKSPKVLREACAAFPGQIVVAVDALGGKVAVEGWQEETGADALEMAASAVRTGAAANLYTDISRDGTRIGPNFAATERLVKRIAPCPVIASGGVATLEDLEGTAKTGAFAVVVGRAIYEQAFTVEEALARAKGP
jgi:phosphoribosylformimino-5-aminoimidazole carboxamide ribotide isomerase